MKAAAALVLAGVLAQVLGGDVPAGNRAHREGRFREAAQRYERALARGDTSARLRYNLGTALLRAGRHDEARPHLEASVARGGPRELRLRGHYNAGNADLEPVARGRVSDEGERRARLERAVARYQRALLTDPGDRDAKWNLELAQRLLRREQGGGGGGGEDRPERADPQPRPDPSPEGEGNRPLSREQAEDILSTAEESERRVQREVMRRNQGTARAVRDW
ncbi:MAG TPA: tetratricopeptide repeat protein [Longimicrobiaceae bacterium]|nr:tetratricopeptide repeat protein [Longimicrobiaceae bacterium]